MYSLIDFLYNLLSYQIGVPQSLSFQSLKSKGLLLKDIVCYPKRMRSPFRIICKHASNKNDRLYQKTTHSDIYRLIRLWKNSPCFRLD